MSKPEHESQSDDDAPIPAAIIIQKKVSKFMSVRKVEPTLGGALIVDGEPWSLEDLSEEIWRVNNYRPNIRQYTAFMKLWRRLALKTLQARLAKEFLEHERGLSDEPLREALRAVILEGTPEETFEYYVAAFKQLIWQIKQKLAGRDTKWDLFLVFYSETGGTGKSSWILNFGRKLGPLFLEDADFELFTDKFRKRALNRYLLVFLDEMQNASDYELRAIKNSVTKHKVQGRGMRTEDEFELARRASFMAASNRHLADDIRDRTMRRFAEILCSEVKLTRAPERGAAIRAIDWDAVWRCVHVDDESPYAENAELFEKHQKALESETEFMTVTQEVFIADPEGRIGCAEAWHAYRECGGRMSIQAFSKEMQRIYESSRPKGKRVFHGITLAKSDL